MKCSSSCRRRRASAKPSSGASISTRRACAASSKRCSLCPPHPTASPPPRWQLGCAHSASKAHHSTVLATAAYDLKKLRGKHIIPPDRPHPPLRAAPNRSQGDDCPPRSPRQSHQTLARRRSATPAEARSTQPKTDRSTLRCHPSSHERRLP